MSGNGSLESVMKAEEKFNQMTQLYYPVAIWVEAVLWGLYVSMFAATCRIMLKKRAMESRASKVFLAANAVLFTLATIHNSISIYRLVRAYALVVVQPQPYFYFLEYNRWDNFSHFVLLALCTWIGDLLVIYRCYLIWRGNMWIIVVPIILLLLSMGTTFVNWLWFLHPQDFKTEQIIPLLNLTFPLNLAQNTLTTGLIAFKIYRQHRTSQGSGLLLCTSIDLLTVVRIVIESALVYTILTIIIIALYFTNHPAVVIPQFALPPCVGMVFALIAIRTHAARSDPGSCGAEASGSVYPTWLSDDQELQGVSKGLNVATVKGQHDIEAATVKMDHSPERSEEEDHNSSHLG